MDRIKIEDLEIFANHGVFPEENRLGQKFLVSAKLEMDTRAAGINDNLELSVNYGAVCRFIEEFMKNHTYRLLEAAAENLAGEILKNFERVETINLEIKKPWAPIGLPLESVSVEIERGWHTAFLSLGSNMGDKKGFLEYALMRLSQGRDCRVMKISDFLVTEPYGMVEQDDFLNACVELKTLLPPLELLHFMQEIELEAHRERTVRWGPRTLDLDLLFYDDIVMDSEELTLPHKEIQKRFFVLEPLCQIAPYKRHPVLNMTVAQLRQLL
jgi:dihydroneopterin aldolase/2-amino-4-hydroxy-6-hydroxymethyldihydropteridine diphosphokinase